MDNALAYSAKATAYQGQAVNSLNAATPERQQRRIDATSSELQGAIEQAMYLRACIKRLKDRLVGALPEKELGTGANHVEPPGHLNKIEAQVNGVRLVLGDAQSLIEEIENLI